MLAFFLAPAFAQDVPLGSERFVPVTEFGHLIENNRGVVLPKDEFQKLLQQAQANVVDREADGITIRGTRYVIKSQDKHALIELTLELQQKRDGWQLLPLPISSFAIESATIDDEPAIVGSFRKGLKARPSFMLLHETAADFELKLTLSSPLATVGSDKVAALKLLPNSAANIEVTCPAERLLHVNDLRLERPAPVDEEATYTFPGGNQKELRLKWTTEQQTTDVQSLTFVTSQVDVSLSGDDLRWESQSKVSVFGNALNRLVLTVPSTLEVTQVESVGLESWKLEDDDAAADRTRVVLNYRQPFTDDRMIAVSGVSTVQPGPLGVPTLQYVDVTSHSGRIELTREGSLRLQVDSSRGVRHLGTRSANAVVSDSEVFDFWLQDYLLRVSVRPRDRELFADIENSLAVADREVVFGSKVTVETLNTPLFELPVSPPEGWKIRSITREDGSPLKWRRDVDEKRLVLEPGQPLSLIHI